MSTFSELKEKIFSYGIFGVQCASLDIYEILALLYEPWTEFVTDEQIRELESSFTTIALESKQSAIIEKIELTSTGHRDDTSINLSDNVNIDYSNGINIDAISSKYPWLNIHLLRHFNYVSQCVLRELTSNLIIRMNTVAWKEYLTNNSFNFTSKEYYFVFDMLIRINHSILISEMRVALNIDPKKMFYIIKKINSLGYIDRIETDGKIFIQMRRDSNGIVIKGKKKLNKRSINSEDNIVFSEEKIDKKIGSDFVLGVPLIMQIKKLIDKSKNGISSKDIEEKFGIKLKIGLKLLGKIADKYDESIKTVEEFEGKIKRTKFYNVNELNKRKEKKRLKIEKGEKDSDLEGITYEDKLQVINRLLSKRPAFLLDKEIYQEFQTALGVKHTFDRRTIVNAAKKGGFNVYRLCQAHSGAKIVIARNDIPADHPSVKAFEQFKKIDNNLTVFQKNLYKFFVYPTKATEIDNLFQTNQITRLNILLNFLNNIQADEFFFDCDILEEMPIYTFFQLVSFKRPRFLLELLESLKKTHIPVNQRENMPELNNLSMSQIFTSSILFDHKHDLIVAKNTHDNGYMQRHISEEALNNCSDEINRKIKKDMFHFDDENFHVSKKEFFSNENYHVNRDVFHTADEYFNYNCGYTHENSFFHPNIVDTRLLTKVAIPLDQRNIEMLESPIKTVFKNELPSDMLKILRIKFEVKPFLAYLRELEKFNKIQLDLRSHKIRLKKTVYITSPIKSTDQHPPFINYISLPEREFFFSKICDIPEHRFIRECLFIINRDYDPNKIKILTARLNAFKKQMPRLNEEKHEISPFLPISLQNMYIDIKKKILFNEEIRLDQYRYQDIEIIMKYMSEKKIIHNNTTDFKNIELTAYFRKKINTKFNGIFHTPIQSDNYFSSMHQYYLKYFDLIYYTIMRRGSYEITKLSEHIEILDPFELYDFFSYFQAHFNAQAADGKIFISIVENDNLLLKFPDE